MGKILLGLISRENGGGLCPQTAMRFTASLVREGGGLGRVSGVLERLEVMLLVSSGLFCFLGDA